MAGDVGDHLLQSKIEGSRRRSDLQRGGPLNLRKQWDISYINKSVE